MLSRRTFLAASLGLLLQPQVAFAKKKTADLKKLGPHTLAREQWPPAITPDFVSIIDKGYALIGDQSGRLAIVDLKREEGPQVIGELFGVGKKIVDLSVGPKRVYVLTYEESQSTNEGQYSIAAVNIAAPTDPQIAHRMPVPFLSEPTCIASFNDIVAVGGTGKNGENQVLLFNMSSKWRESDGEGPLATLNVSQPPTKLNYQDKQLVVLEPGAGTTIIDVYDVANPRGPSKLSSMKLDGNYTVMARVQSDLSVAGQNKNGKSEWRLISLRPTPHVVQHDELKYNEILDIAAQRGQTLVLGSVAGRLYVEPFFYGKGNAGSHGEAVALPPGSHAAASKARIAARDKEAYVAADSGSVQVLVINKTGWQYLYSHTIPRLPVASVAFAGNRAVLAGADIKVYDVSQPERPTLIASAEPGTAVRSVVLDEDNILALTRDGLTLRKIERPSDVIATLKLAGQALAFDSAAGRAYVLSPNGKTTKMTPVKVDGTLVAEPAQTFNGSYKVASAAAGRLLVSGLNTLTLYDVANGNQLGTRVFPNLAIRDIALLGDMAVITALDPNSKGFLLTINTLRSELPTVGSIDLPQDAVAIAVSGRNAVVVGRSAQGKDAASIVDLSNSAAPKVVASFPVLEAASAVAIRDKVALVGGRGLELLRLTS